MNLFRELSEEEEREFRKWARDHYKTFQSIQEFWHPVVKDECKKINEEAFEAEGLRQLI